MVLEATMIMCVLCPATSMKHATPLTLNQESTTVRVHGTGTIRRSERCMQNIQELTISDRPTRFEAQSDAVSLIFQAKTQANPESSVGLMTMGGKGPEVLVTLTTDFGKILSGLHATKIKGELHLTTGIQVAGVCKLQAQNQA